VRNVVLISFSLRTFECYEERSRYEINSFVEFSGIDLVISLSFIRKKTRRTVSMIEPARSKQQRMMMF